MDDKVKMAILLAMEQIRAAFHARYMVNENRNTSESMWEAMRAMEYAIEEFRKA